MPTLCATIAYNAAQRIAAEMRDIHAKEEALNEELEKASDEPTRGVIEFQIIRLCVEWNRLHREYTAAFAQYASAVEAGQAK